MKLVLTLRTCDSSSDSCPIQNERSTAGLPLVLACTCHFIYICIDFLVKISVYFTRTLTCLRRRCRRPCSCQASSACRTLCRSPIHVPCHWYPLRAWSSVRLDRVHCHGRCHCFRHWSSAQEATVPLQGRPTAHPGHYRRCRRLAEAGPGRRRRSTKAVRPRS